MERVPAKEYRQILLIVVLHGMLVLMISEMSNPTFLDWIKGEIGTVLGALLMLITGRPAHPEPSATVTTTKSVTVAPEAAEAGAARSQEETQA